VFIDKAAVLQALEELGEYEIADEARQVLPDRLDAERHRHLFLHFGIDPRDLFGHIRRPRPS
jgi:hypothetical protein